jgi:hypothetical protein
MGLLLANLAGAARGESTRGADRDARDRNVMVPNEEELEMNYVRLTLGFVTASALAIAIAACSSDDPDSPGTTPKDAGPKDSQADTSVPHDSGHDKDANEPANDAGADATADATTDASHDGSADGGDASSDAKADAKSDAGDAAKD